MIIDIVYKIRERLLTKLISKYKANKLYNNHGNVMQHNTSYFLPSILLTDMYRFRNICLIDIYIPIHNMYTHIYTFFLLLISLVYTFINELHKFVCNFSHYPVYIYILFILINSITREYQLVLSNINGLVKSDPVYGYTYCNIHKLIKYFYVK